MITKILLTLLVAVVGYLYLKRRSASKTEAKPVPRTNQSEQKPELPMKLLAIGFLVFALISTSGFFAYRWFDGRTLLEVSLISPDQPVQTFQVYKKDLEERSFISTDGQIVRIAAQERLQVRRTDN